MITEQFEAILTGSDSPIDGIVTATTHDGYGDAYEFRSLDGSLILVTAKDVEGNWVRIDGTVPYLSGWTGELADQINSLHK